MPFVAAGFFVVDQPHFDEAQRSVQCDRQGDQQLWVALAGRQFQPSSLELDASVLPDGGAKLLAAPGKVSVGNACSAQCPGCFARLEEALLGSVNRMRVQGRFLPARRKSLNLVSAFSDSHKFFCVSKRQ